MEYPSTYILDARPALQQEIHISYSKYSQNPVVEEL